ncbi:methionine adenosyltransferase 2 subunit beta [Colletotrichum liriopes]|uniref:Methionine adenosyltransferase 2 subunit beta n=1 Tax=Colletotrichum liriopes TaxID=708192 RepID=A0AA37GJY7_9PEZI|nr:methionine adenosyltransferase 2 subunit beta [Colletotrichum liriopes]
MAGKDVVVTGATGLLGRQVTRAFDLRSWNVKGTGYSRADGVSVFKVDLGNTSEVEKFLDESNDPDAARALNVAATKSLANLCAARSTLLIYISTDYVFSGKPGEAPYEADAPTGPTNLYGQTKLDGELAVLEEYKAAGLEGLGLVLRVPVLYGKAHTPAESATNILMDTLWKTQDGQSKVKMDHWAIRYPTNTEDVGRVCHDIAGKYLEASDRSSMPKILQFSSEDRMTKYEICQKFADIMDLSMDGIIANTEGNDPNASVQRPYDCHLSTRALKELGIDVSTSDFIGWWRREVHAFRH